MADKTVTIGDPTTGDTLAVLYTDNGDGTYSPNIAAPLTLDPTNLALAAQLPAALGAHGALKVEGVASGTVIPVDNAVSAALGDGVASNAALTKTAAGTNSSAPPAIFVMAFNGDTWDRARTPNVFKDLSALAIGTITTVWTPAGGKTIRLMGGSISVSAAVSVLFEDNTSPGTVVRTPKLLADTPYNFDLGNGKLLALADHVLKATSSAAANITGYLYGTEE